MPRLSAKKASRIVINKCQDDRSAQICLEYYTKGTKGKKGKTKEKGKSGQGTWIEPSAANAICRETIEINSFNVSEVQRVNISLHTLSTITEDRITVKYKKKKEADRTEYYPIGLAGLCGGKCPWVNMNGGEECCCFFLRPNLHRVLQVLVPGRRQVRLQLDSWRTLPVLLLLDRRDGGGKDEDDRTRIVQVGTV